MKLSDIKLNEDNPRYIKDAQLEKLVKSIRDFPRMLELRPIVVDGDGVIIGGNMRYRALLEIGYSEVEDSWVKQASDFTPDELREFVIKDNLPFGDWDWEQLANNWNEEELNGWGLEIPGFEGEAIDPDSLTDEFSLKDGDRDGFQQMTFTLADEQVELIKRVISQILKTEEYEYLDVLGNENSNGNALYLAMKSWEEQRI